jgi:hypothetical protein
LRSGRCDERYWLRSLAALGDLDSSNAVAEEVVILIVIAKTIKIDGSREDVQLIG